MSDVKPSTDQMEKYIDRFNSEDDGLDQYEMQWLMCQLLNRRNTEIAARKQAEEKMEIAVEALEHLSEVHDENEWPGCCDSVVVEALSAIRGTP